MSGFNGSGTFNISGVGLPYTSGTTISSSVANQLNTDLATGLSTCITKDGQSTVTANIGWNNFNINNLSALGIGTASPSGQMEVKSGSTTNFIIDSSGNVGIGTSSPETPLTVKTQAAVGFPALKVKDYTDSSGVYSASVSSGNWRYIAGNSYYYNAGLFRSKTTNSSIINMDFGALSFYTDSGLTVNTDFTPTERMRIDSNGYALIGYTSSNGAYKLQVNSQIFATSSTIATSDVKYKENVNTLENALDLVCALNPVSFDWKAHPVHNFDRSTTTTGFIAQEVQTALQNTAYVNAIVKTNTCVIEPEEKDADGNVTKPAVTEEFLGIAEGNLIAILTKAIQELKTELDLVKTELAALKGS